MYLYTNGDSFTYGVGVEHRNKAFPYVLADRMLAEMTNDAYPGSSHDRILRRTMLFVGEWLEQDMPPGALQVVIGWGFARRMEFYYEPDLEAEEQEDNYVRYSSDPLSKRVKHRYPEEASYNFIKSYHESFSNRAYSATRALTRVLSLQSFLKDCGVPYLFFNSAWTIPEVGNNSYLRRLVDTDRYYGFSDKNQTFDAWTRNMGHSGRTPLGHPDMEAHQAWADHLYQLI